MRSGFLSALVAIVLFALLPVGLTAQVHKVRSVDGRRLQESTDTFAIFLIHGSDTIRTGTRFDELKIVNRQGHAMLQRFSFYSDEGLDERVDSVIDLWPTLAPVRHRSFHGPRRGMDGEWYPATHEVFNFGPDSIRGRITPPWEDSIPVQIWMPEGTYNGASLDLVLRASNLTEHWREEVSVFVARTQRVAQVAVRVVGVEMIREEACWRVEADVAGVPAIFWIGQDSRRLRQQVLRPWAEFELLLRPVSHLEPAPDPA